MKVPVILRNNVYSLSKRVPARYKSIDTREKYVLSLGTDSRTEAMRKGALMLDQMMKAWEARLAGNSPDADIRWQAALDIAKAYQVDYQPLRKVIELPRAEVVARLAAIPDTADGEPDMVVAAAVLGTAKEPRVMLSTAMNEFWSLAGDRLVGSSPDQERKYRADKARGINSFAELIEDKPLQEIGHTDFEKYRGMLVDRVVAEEITARTANKMLVHLGDVLKTLNKRKRLGMDLSILPDLRLSDGGYTPRPPFSDEWIKTKFLGKGAMRSLNGEARAILLGMINTGCRPSELSGLTPDRIHIDCDIPFIQIRPGVRKLKTRQSSRDIPLLGASLDALKPFAKTGFPTYSDNPGWSACVAQYLDRNGLLETPRHSAYSLRHSFETRMRSADVPYDLRTLLMGHSSDRPEYGEWSLSKKLEQLKKIAL